MKREPRVEVRQVLRFAGAVMVAVLAFAAEARADGALLGTVLSSETKERVLDVVVTATSPTMQDEQTVVTDELGQYRLPPLPPGIYALRFEKEGFKTLLRAGLQVSPEQELRVDVELLPSDFTEELQIGPCGPPPVDVMSTSSIANLDEDFFHSLAVNVPSGKNGAVRSFDNLAGLAPGARSDAYGVSIDGASAFENRFVVDGLSTTDPVFGVNALPVNVEFLGNLHLVTSGAMPEYGRSTGGTVETVTRSGSSDRFSGSVFANWAPGVLEGARASGQVGLKNLGDFGATLGGPLVKDRLWFFAGVVPSLSRVEQTRDAGNVFADQRGVQALGKLSYRINTWQSVSLMVLTAPAHSGGDGRLTVDRLTGSVPTSTASSPEAADLRALDSNTTLSAFSYSGVFLDTKLLLDVDAGWLRGRVSRPELEGPGAPLTDAFDRYQAHARATYVLMLAGYHTFKAGVDTEFLSRGSNLGTQAPRVASNLLGGYVQDSWYFLDRFTVNAGLRYDAQSLDTSGRTLVLGRPVSPRLGVVVDPYGKGQMKVFAHYAKYQGVVPLIALEPGRSVDPNLVPLSTRELAAGAAFEVLPMTSLDVTYTHRRLDSTLAVLRGAEGSGLFLGNPGLGLASDVPAPQRTYEAVMVVMNRVFYERWLMRASYTWSRLRGNYPGLLLAPAGQGEPGLLSDSDLRTWMNSSGLLPADRTHSFKLFAAREFALTNVLTSTLGVSYQGDSGASVDGTAERTPWVHDLDVHAGVDYRVDRNRTVSFSLDVFNVFNAHAVTWMEQGPGSVPVALQYQPPRQVRLGARYSF